LEVFVRWGMRESADKNELSKGEVISLVGLIIFAAYLVFDIIG